MNENELHSAIGEMSTDIKYLVGHAKDQETRIRALEMFRNWSAGVAAMIVFLFTIAKSAGIALASKVIH